MFEIIKCFIGRIANKFRRYRIVVQPDSCKEAEIVSGMEGWENVFGENFIVSNSHNDEFYKKNKVRFTIATLRTRFGAKRRSAQYAKMRIFSIIIKM